MHILHCHKFYNQFAHINVSGKRSCNDLQFFCLTTVFDYAIIIMKYLFVLSFYGTVNPMGSYRALSVYLTARLLGRLSPLSG